jgi:hypothetical protein
LGKALEWFWKTLRLGKWAHREALIHAGAAALW